MKLESKSDAKRKFKNELVVLAALSNSDGQMHPREVDAIIEYVEKEAEWERLELSSGEVSALKEYVKRLRITQDRLVNCLDLLFADEGKARLHSQKLRRFLACARLVIDADGILHNSEIEFFAQLEELTLPTQV